MSDAVRKLYEKEKHSKQVTYGPHLFFRTVQEAIVGQKDEESPQKEDDKHQSPVKSVTIKTSPAKLEIATNKTERLETSYHSENSSPL